MFYPKCLIKIFSNLSYTECHSKTFAPRGSYQLSHSKRVEPRMSLHRTSRSVSTKIWSKKTCELPGSWLPSCSIFFLLLCDVFMWVWLDFYFVEVDRAKLCAATAGPRGNLDWSRLGSFSPEIFCAATLLKRKPHNLTLLTKRKQHQTNTSHTPKNVTYKKRTVWKQEAGSFTQIFSCLWFRKSPNLQNQKHK